MSLDTIATGSRNEELDLQFAGVENKVPMWPVRHNQTASNCDIILYLNISEHFGTWQQSVSVGFNN